MHYDEKLADTMAASDEATARLRYHLSGAMAMGARQMTGLAQAAEIPPFPEAIDAHTNQHRTYCLSAVLLSACALEAYINDICISFGDPPQIPPPHLPPTFYQEAHAYWVNGERAPTIQKYQRVLAIAGVEPLDKTDPVLDGAQTLITWRNALVHFKAEWDDLRQRHSELESSLSGRFHLNPFAGADRPLFPLRLLSAGGAAWAIEAMAGLVEAFTSRLRISEGMPLIHLRFRPTRDAG